MTKFTRLILYTALAMATIYAASELIAYLVQLCPVHSEKIRHYSWLIVVLGIGVFFLRPIFLLYMGKRPD